LVAVEAAVEAALDAVIEEGEGAEPLFCWRHEPLG
jgi:hypothetical protein